MSGPTSPEGVAEAAAHPTRAEIIALAGNTLTHFCHQASANAGWWTDLATGEPIDPFSSPHLVPAKLMLIVSEVAEAMEGHRKNLMDDKLPHRLAVEVELADAVIRIADLCGAMGLTLGAAIAEKMEFNASRVDHTLAHRRGEKGKAY